MHDATAVSPGAVSPETTAVADLDGFLASVERRALRMATIRLRHREDAMDAVQEAMMRLVSHYAGRPPEEWTPLFWSILQRRIVDVQRRRRVRSIVQGWLAPRETEDGSLPAWEPVDPGAGPLETASREEMLTRLEAALHELPRRQFEAFSLRILNDLDVSSTARVMGCSEGSVKTHLSRARAALRARLEDHT